MTEEVEIPKERTKRLSYRAALLFKAEKRIKCEFCNRTYANAKTLYKHYREKHKQAFNQLDDFICTTSGPVVKKNKT